LKVFLPENISPLLVSSMLLYLVLIVLVLALSSQILIDFADRQVAPDNFILLLGAVFSLLLLSIVAANVVRLFRQRAGSGPGAAFRVKITGFILGVTLLSSLPHMVLSINFISTLMNSALFNRIYDSVRGGLETAFDYDSLRVDSLQALARNSAFPAGLESLLGRPDEAWQRWSADQPLLHSIQVFDQSLHELLFRGDPAGRSDPAVLRLQPEGLLPRETNSSGNLVIRYGRPVRAGGRSYHVVIGSVLPEHFSHNAEQLTSLLEAMARLGAWQPVVFTIGLALYGFFSLPLMLLAFLASFVLSDQLIKPFASLEEATRKVAEGDFSFRILSRADDSLSFLVSSFNAMIGELDRNRAELVKVEKFGAWQEVAQRLAHEIKNPLTPIKLSAQRILKKYEEAGPDFAQALSASVDSIIHEVNALDKLINEFRSFARLPQPRLEPVGIGALVREVVGQYFDNPTGVVFDFSGLREAFAQADPAQLRQVLVNLVRNALEAMPAGGRLFLGTDVIHKGDTRWCRIQIRDQGMGIPAELRERVFSPYFTTKENGSGLGLPIAERIVIDHKGRIWFESWPGVGTIFYVDLPMEKAT
jgi:two-component system, NtrC family, nitrogen regulation sensor histidine kinase NtrY